MTIPTPIIRTDLNQPLETWELDQLATYNSERTRGIVHTDEWKAKMARLQERFKANGFMTPQKQWWKP
jgi:hypothetical protein